MAKTNGLSIAAAFFLIAAPLFAADTLGYVYRASVLVITEDNGLEGDPMPVLPSPGFALSFPLIPMLRFEPGMDLYSTYYGYSYQLDRAVPYALENRSTLVYGIVLNLPVAFVFSLANLPGFHVAGGISTDFRVCLTADGLEGEDLELASDESADVAAYFWGSGRWLFLNGAFGFDFPIMSRGTLGLELRSWYPIYRLWSGEDLPALENLRVALGLRFVYY